MKLNPVTFTYFVILTCINTEVGSKLGAAVVGLKFGTADRENEGAFDGAAEGGPDGENEGGADGAKEGDKLGNCDCEGA